MERRLGSAVIWAWCSLNERTECVGALTHAQALAGLFARDLCAVNRGCRLPNSVYHFFFRSEATASAPGVVPAGGSGSAASGTFFGFLASLLPCLFLVM
jgi:hypothetical protein